MAVKLDFTDPQVNLYFARLALGAFAASVANQASLKLMHDHFWPENKEEYDKLIKGQQDRQLDKITNELYEMFGELPPEILDLLRAKK